MRVPQIIKYLLEKKEIKIPLNFLKQKAITELDKALSSGRPIYVSGQFKKMHANVEEYFDKDSIDFFLKQVKAVSDQIKEEKPGFKLSEDNKKILNFLSGLKSFDYEDILEMAGPYHFTLEVLSELNNSEENIPRTIKIVLFMWLFVNSYEMLLHQVDRKLNHYLTPKTKLKGKDVDNFLKINRGGYRSHATAGNINKILSKILNLPEENNSIFGSKSGGKVIRNKISHTNLYYDSEKDKIIALSGEEYTPENFIQQYYEIFYFLYEWINTSIQSKFDRDLFMRDIKKLFVNRFVLFNVNNKTLKFFFLTSFL
jgi:hypothetical protein